MSIETVESINKSLREMDYRGTITFAGFGEPLLLKSIKKHVQTLGNGVQYKQIKIITNGDYLTPELAGELVGAGVNCIKVSMYDKDDTEYFESFLSEYEDVERIYKHYYDGLPSEVEINRNDIWKKPPVLKIERACYLPFYKMFINWNGDVGLCSNDWNVVETFGNVNDKPIYEIWESDYMAAYRKMLMANKRVASPCISCDVNGQVLGKESFDYFNSYYE